MRALLLLSAFAATLLAAPGAQNLELVGQLALGPGFNADVWAAPPDETAATVRARFAAALAH